MGRFDQIMKILKEYGKSLGAQLIVAKGGQLKYFKSFRVANREIGELVTTNHVMRYFNNMLSRRGLGIKDGWRHQKVCQLHTIYLWKELRIIRWG
ncbi:hypothetical protein KI387_031224, partial [Taxus chinensis]